MRGQRYVDKLEKLAPKTYLRIVDKMPGNFTLVGLINAILPNAKIIHSRRHPVETCLSCYRIHFAEGQHWSYNLRELGCSIPLVRDRTPESKGLTQHEPKSALHLPG